MTMQKIRILVTTTASGQRYAKGDEINLDEKLVRDLIATEKAAMLKEKQKLKKSASETSMVDKADGKT